MSKPRILVLGSGGREHALCWHLKNFQYEVFCAPGSDGIALEVPCMPFKDFSELLQIIQKLKIDLVVVGPEKYLAEGVADFLQNKGVNVFGPTKLAAQLESDKAWAKDFCIRHNIPQARVETLTRKDDFSDAISKFQPPYVLKASGLAAGKGVWIGSDLKEAQAFAQEALKAHPALVIEDFLPGEEVSYFAMVDGDHFLVLGGAQDHKRLLENDRGPNTGGMGAYSPVPILTQSLEQKIISKILRPTLQGLKTDKIYYRGFVFIGAMIVKDEPYLLEYNCRMGDPETQALLLRLQSSLVDLIDSLKRGEPMTAKLSSLVSLNVVVAAQGYPDNPKSGFTMLGLDAAPSSSKIFHSGTKKSKDGWTAVGGRLFSVNTAQNTLFDCQQSLYPWIESLPFLNDVTYRRDIAVKAYKHLIADAS